MVVWKTSQYPHSSVGVHIDERNRVYLYDSSVATWKEVEAKIELVRPFKFILAGAYVVDLKKSIVWR